MKPIRLITLAPGHFHAALVQKRMAPGVHRRAYVYGPLDRRHRRPPRPPRRVQRPPRRPDRLGSRPARRRRLARALPPRTARQHGRALGPQPARRSTSCAPRSATACTSSPTSRGSSSPPTSPSSKSCFREADLREVLVWDVMTERHEVTNQLQRELVRDPDLFGHWQAGTPEQPALVLESVHYLKKSVAGRPLSRPWWWFDPAISGEAMADVGTHLADLALWLDRPDQPVDYRTRHPDPRRRPLAARAVRGAVPRR